MVSMSSGVKVTWETRLGSIAESEIESRLKYFSLPVKYNLDVGIDFYCELIKNETPSTPFYVQAKGNEHFDDNWGQGIKKSTIVYWLNQPFPVFLVAYDEHERECYWMSIEDSRYPLLQRFETKGETLYIKMDKSHVLARGRDANAEFISKIRDGVLSIMMWRGVAWPKGEGYVKQIPMPPRSEVELLNLKETIRMNSYSLIQHYAAKNDLPSIYDMCSFLAKFDKWHYNHFLWLGLVCMNLGRREEAIRSFDEALKICEMDKTWERESMEKLKEQTRALAQRARELPG